MKLPKKIPWLLIGILLLILGLRIPSWFEPYWYGDEGIYLALGQAMQRGAVLYRDIWDNKPPLLYILYALHPTLLFAKVMATTFVLGTCYVIFKLGLKIFRTKFPAIISAFLVGVFLSIPLFEGNIANAELFFTLPIVLGGYLIFNLKGVHKDRTQLFLIGLLAVAAFLFKVPALFDFLGMFLFLTVYLFDLLWNRKRWLIFAKAMFDTFWPIILAFLVPIVLVVGYFILNRALSDFLIASFSQNASYVAVDSGPLSKLSNPLFVKGLLLLLSSLILLILFLRKLISKELLFLTLWFGFSLYGALLSNRPYMHYLLQIIPPVILLIIYIWFNLKNTWLLVIPLSFILYTLFSQFQTAFHLPTEGYYANWFDYISERKSWEDYVSFFDPRTLNSYAVSNYIKSQSTPNTPIFVWGDAAFVYVLANRPAATKFIQAHHLTTISPKNYDLIIDRLNLIKPKFILISRPVHFAFPKLEILVAKNYRQAAVFEDLYVYQITPTAR